MEPQAEVVRPGSNISLHCKIANMGDLSQCRWQKNRFPVGIFSGKYSIPENSRDTGNGVILGSEWGVTCYVV